MQYLYQDGGLYYFMNTETYDQVGLTEEQVGDSLKFVKDNERLRFALITERYSQSSHLFL